MAVVSAVVGAGASIIGGAVAANQADKAGKRAGRAARNAREEMDRIKASRVPITNPYAGNTNLSSLATNLSDMISNPFANLSVATQASEIQMEQSDMALANSLETLATTGASAGGATALAQAALASKKGVAANIEQQEVNNEKLRAQGESQMERMQMQEAQRIQGVQIAEGQRMQTQMAAGNQFQTQMKESRTNSDLGRAAGQEQQAMANQASANEAQASAWGGAISGVVGAATSLISVPPVAPPVPAKPSDRRLKKNIKSIGKSNSGLKIYSFEYIDKKYGEGIWQGVMSDEVPVDAVIKHLDGYDRVDYSKIDVQFKQI